MLTPILHTPPRRIVPRAVRRWWAGLTRDERQGLVVAAVVVALFAAIRVLIGTGLGVIR